MRRIAAFVVAVMMLSVPAVAARTTAASQARVCRQPRLLILSAFPAEMGAVMKATKLDGVEPIRSAAPGRREFWTGRLKSKPVILALTGIGPVNATATTAAAFHAFKCIKGVVFSGVAGAGSDDNGARGSVRQSRIGDVTVPDRWANHGGAKWSTAAPSMLATATAVARRVSLQKTTPAGDPACACVDAGTVPGVTFRYKPAVMLHGDGSTTDPFGGHAAPCVQHGGDLDGCEPCPASLGTSPDPQRFVSGVKGVADPSFFTGLIAQGPASPHQFIEVDEETGAAAAVANSAGVPFIGFRGISDGTPDPLMLPGFPSQFFVYKQLAADNAAVVTMAFVAAWSTHQ
jgi:nucleoside phosphorylase